MLKTTVALMTLLAAPVGAWAVQDQGGVETELVEPAKVDLFPLPVLVHDEAGRLLAVPPPSDVRGEQDVLQNLPVLPEAVGDAGAEPGRTVPRRRGEP